jgi:hypothetical protein
MFPVSAYLSDADRIYLAPFCACSFQILPLSHNLTLLFDLLTFDLKSLVSQYMFNLD